MKAQNQVPPAGVAPAVTGGFLEVTVICTGVKETLAALRTAGGLACNLRASIQLLVPQLVPYPLDLNNPPVTRDFTACKIATLIEGQKIPTSVHVILCRERESACKASLQPHSLVVIGHSKHWWKSAESRMAKALRRLGHEVIMVAA